MATKKSGSMAANGASQVAKRPAKRTTGVKTTGVMPSGAKAAKTKTTKSRTAAAKVVPLQATIHSGVMSNGQTRAKRRS